MRNVNKNYGNRLTECRKAKGLTITRLAEMAGYSRQHISGIETGSKSMTTNVAFTVAPILDVDPDYLLGKTEYKTETDRFIKKMSAASSENTHRDLILKEILETLGYSLRGTLGIKHDESGTDSIELSQYVSPPYDDLPGFSPVYIALEKGGSPYYIPFYQYVFLAGEILDYVDMRVRQIKTSSNLLMVDKIQDDLRIFNSSLGWIGSDPSPEGLADIDIYDSPTAFTLAR